MKKYIEIKCTYCGEMLGMAPKVYNENFCDNVCVDGHKEFENNCAKYRIYYGIPEENINKPEENINKVVEIKAKKTPDELREMVHSIKNKYPINSIQAIERVLLCLINHLDKEDS